MRCAIEISREWGIAAALLTGVPEARQGGVSEPWSSLRLRTQVFNIGK
jgi:hypothetical protein